MSTNLRRILHIIHIRRPALTNGAVLLFVEYRYGVGYGLFVSLHTVLVDLFLVLLAVGQAACAADASADARHALDEVRVEHTLALPEQSCTASFDSVAGAGFEIKVLNAVFLESLRHSIGKTAAAGEYSAEIRCVVENIFGEGHYIDISAVEQSLKLFKSHRRVDIGLDLVLLNLRFLCRAGTDEYNLAGRLMFFDIFGYSRHGGKIVGNERLEIREGFFDVVDKRGAA